jgi:toxin CcdB
VFEIEGLRYVAVAQELAGIPGTALGGAVADLSFRRDDIVAALDLLITGI